MPLIDIPVHVFGGGHCSTGLTTKQHDDGIAFGGDESEEEDVFDAAVVAFKGCLAQLMLRVERHFFVSRTDKVVYDVGARCATAGVTEPFVARKAFDDAAGRMDSTESVHKPSVSKTQNKVQK